MMTMTIYGGRKEPKRLSAPATFDCPTCKSYGYSDRQKPVRVGRTKHHPACSKVALYQPPPPMSPAVATAGFFERVPLIDRISNAMSRMGATARDGVENGVAKVSGIFGADKTASGNELLAILNDAITQLNTDITQDGCGDWYGKECMGQVPAVDDLTAKINAFRISNGGSYGAADALRLAGVPTTSANISAFASCVKTKESSSAIPTGTAAYCALQVRDSTSGEPPLLPKAHTTVAFRDRWQTFVASFGRFADKWATAQTDLVDSSMKPTEAELAAQMTQYNTYRQQFLDSGGQTSSPSIDEPMSLPVKIGLYVVLAGVLYVGGVFLYKRYMV